MKKKIGEIYNKPIVIGDKNLMTKNEVHKDEINGGSKEYDDLNTYLYYDDRIVSFEGMELPLCGFIVSALSNMLTYFHNLNIIFKINNTEDVFGINYGNYMPLGNLVMEGSGFNQELVLLIKGISIPKYVLPESIINVSGVPVETDKMYIFDFMKVMFCEAGAGDFIEFMKTQPTITREEFFDLLK